MLKALWSLWCKWRVYINSLEPKELFWRFLVDGISVIGFILIGCVFTLICIMADPEIQSILMGG